MAIIKKKAAVKKAAFGTTVPKPKAKPSVEKKKVQTPADFYPASYDKKFPRTPGGGDNYGTTIEMEKERVKKGLSPYKKGGMIKKAKSGGSFPDLNKDGKVTKADVLKGRGVIAKSGTSMKKCKYGCK